jgi:hypothetical protein
MLAQQIISPDVAVIRDYLAWSILNMFLGQILIGLLPLTFSIICRSRKRANNVNSAWTMSTLALVFNILATLIGVAIWVLFIVLLVGAQENCDPYYC